MALAVSSRALAKEGFKLVLVARRQERLAELEVELAVDSTIVAVDLGTPDGLATLERETRQLDVGLLVASAGFGTSGPFLEAPLDAELSMIDVNCRAVAALSHHFGQRLVKRGRGGLRHAANYAATKAWVQSFAEGLQLELAPLGVDVLASAPGPIRSGFGERADMKMSMALGPEAVATSSLNALSRRGTVRPGWLSKVLEWSLMFLPRWGRVRVMSLVMGGMTAHQPLSPRAASR
jgi:uncharacterized protein